MKTLLIPLIGSSVCLFLTAALAWTQPWKMAAAAEPMPVDPGFAPAAPAPARRSAVPTQTWRDPNEAAFTVEIPVGWQARGGVVRPSPLLTQTSVELHSPDGKVVCRGGDDEPFFTMPNQTLDFFGFREGMCYGDPGSYQSPISRYLPGGQYFVQKILPRRAPGAKVTQKPNQQLKSPIDTGYFTDRFDVGEVQYDFVRGGERMTGAAICITRFLSADGGQTGNWCIHGLYYWEAPAARAVEADATLLQLVKTFQFRPDWLAAETKGNRERADIVRRSQQQIAQQISDSYWRDTEIRDRTARRFSEAIRGTSDYRDELTGRIHYGLENRHRHHWINARGEIIGTDSEFSPGLEWRPLQRVD